MSTQNQVTNPRTSNRPCTMCSALHTALSTRFGMEKLAMPTPETYPAVFTNTYRASLDDLVYVETMESSLAEFINERSPRGYGDVRVWRLVTTDKPDKASKMVEEAKKQGQGGRDDGKKKETQKALVDVTLTVLVDFPAEAHVGPLMIGLLFGGEFPAPLSKWKKKTHEQEAEGDASLLRLEFWKEVFDTEQAGKALWIPK
ncbi:hypothetical protein BJY01DRAFT_215406 [Aspergillus pseudoustus]|uniref:Thioredoxin-like protein n=1 Tax=Aspergillus pseudoustus TaxID=1810923 RepID=A0ABR4JV14_9EURO